MAFLDDILEAEKRAEELIQKEEDALRKVREEKERAWEAKRQEHAKQLAHKREEALRQARERAQEEGEKMIQELSSSLEQWKACVAEHFPQGKEKVMTLLLRGGEHSHRE